MDARHHKTSIFWLNGVDTSLQVHITKVVGNPKHVIPINESPLTMSFLDIADFFR